MRRVTAVFYTFEEMSDLLKQVCFQDNEDFDVEVVDTYYWRINYFPDDYDGDDPLIMSDYDALAVLSKVVGFPLSNTHATRDGIWLEGFPEIPKSTAKKGRR